MMRLVTFRTPRNETRIGMHVDTDAPQIIDLTAADPVLFSDMLTLIRNEKKSMPLARKELTRFESGDRKGFTLHPEKDVELLAPIPRPVSMRDGYAFRQHVETARRNRGVPMIPEFDEFPIFYFTNHLAVTGPGELHVYGRQLERLDFELEVAIVTGKSGRNIKASEADRYIFGYMIMNDWSARALQMEEMKLNLGPAKGKDFATSIGPWLVPREDLEEFMTRTAQGEKHNLRMQAWVNGIQLSDGNLKDISWTFAQILERISYGTNIEAGEVVGSGTVGTGCFLELNGSKITDNQWLKPGDEIVLEVDQLGRLAHKIVEIRE